MAKSNLTIEVERLKKEFYQGMAELRESQKRADEELRESEKKRKKWREEWDKGMAELRESQKKTDAQIDKTDAEIDKLTDSVRKVSDGYGRFVEGIISPSAIKHFSDFGYKVKDVSHRKKIFKNGQIIAEYDTFIEAGFNGERYFIIGEAKTHCSSGDVDEFIDQIKKVRKFKKFDENIIIIGFIAAVSYGKGIEKYIIKQGLYLFKVTDDIMELKVPKDFIPNKF